ncbi:EamA family transporter [Paenimyroides baculatum]|uniref:EamA family transporter n=1 Tax=Paenimyroides baculatum TaxID=2608000 RepID=A0A5M6CRJ4_9FLAO|nr:EamA family transporter [Paenimyroides baculatum]
MAPHIFLFYKFLIAFVVLSTVFFNHLKNISKKTVKIGFLIGIPLLAGNFLQSIGLKYTTVSNSAFITGMDVLLIPILKFAENQSVSKYFPILFDSIS